MCARINAACRTTHDGDTRRCEPLCKLHRRRLTVGGEFACADDADAACIGDNRATIVEYERRIEDFPQNNGIVCIINRNERNVQPCTILFDLRGQIGVHRTVAGKCIGNYVRERTCFPKFRRIH